jgi:hypothetical protein
MLRATMAAGMGFLLVASVATRAHAGPVASAPSSARSAQSAPSSAASNVTASVGSAEIDAAIASLADANPLVRKTAAASLADLPGDVVGALEPRLLRTPEANPGPMWQALDRARKSLAKDADERALAIAVAMESGSATNRSLALLLAGIHACEKQGQLAGARVLVRLLAAHKAVVKGPARAALERMGDGAVAALIEGRKSDDRDQRQTVSKLLDAMGRFLPSDAVAVRDPQALADVLTAFGKTKDVDAARVIVSYLNADRAPVREAARWSIAQLGEQAKPALKDAYETFSNEKAGDDWSAERLQKELLAAYDRVRLAEVFKLLDEGVASRDAGHLDQAIASFDALLARAPSFERRAELAPAYVDLAHAKQATDRKAAHALLAKAARLAAGTPLGPTIESELLVLEAQDLLDSGVVDTSLLDRALALDPANQHAREMKSRWTADEVARGAQLRRVLWASAAGVLATVLALLFVGRRRSVGPGDRTRRPRAA